jgi:hypothetical protein
MHAGCLLTCVGLDLRLRLCGRFHGTTADAVESILTNGFQTPKHNDSSRAMYGFGVYLASNVSRRICSWLPSLVLRYIFLSHVHRPCSRPRVRSPCTRSGMPKKKGGCAFLESTALRQCIAPFQGAFAVGDCIREARCYLRIVNPRYRVLLVCDVFLGARKRVKQADSKLHLPARRAQEKYDSVYSEPGNATSGGTLNDEVRVVRTRLWSPVLGSVVYLFAVAFLWPFKHLAACA